MEHAHTNLETKSLFATQSDRKYDFRKKFAKVRNMLTMLSLQAYGKLRVWHHLKKIKLLEDMSLALRYDFYNKARMDEIIKKADKIFRSHSMKV